MGDAPPAADVGSLDCLKVDRRPLDWNGPTRRIFSRFRDEDLDRPIIDHIERLASRCPDMVAVTDADASLTFGQLWEGLTGLAETIAAETGPGDLIGILLPACRMFPLAMLACLAAGRPFVPLDPHYPDEWLNQVLEDARPTLIVGQSDLAGDLRVGASGAPVLHLDSLPKAPAMGWRPAGLDMDEPACVLFTSGSTGRPKGIVNSQRALLQRVAQSVNAGHVNADDRFLTLASLCTIVGVRDAMTALLAGARLHLIDPQRADAREVLDVLHTEAITILFAFPALLRSIVASSSERAGDHLRLVRLGGDTALWSDIDLLRAWLAPRSAIQLIYAATEAPMMQWFVYDACRNGEARIPIGYPLPGNPLAVIDESGRPALPGEIGELAVGGSYVSLGNWMDGRFVPRAAESFGGQSCRIFRTGDLVRQRPDGLLERLGRRDRQVKIRGVRVELDGVEAALRQHPLVGDVGTLARPGGDDGELTLIAYVCAREGASEGLLEELRELMRSAPSAMRPGRFYLVPEIPRLPSSKLDVRALTVLDEDQVQRDLSGVAAAAKVRSADADRIARTVARVWREALNTPVSGSEHDFFEAGGDSLKAVAFMLELERALGRELSLTLINEAPTFGAICDALREHRSSRYTPLVLLKAGGGSSPVFLVHGAGGNVVDLFPIARAMAYPGAVIGIQARGLVRQDAPHTSVEAMAGEYLGAVRARQPVGPYHLCGYSFGGLVAFEMARRLHEAGDEVGLVGLFDTTTSQMGWRLRSWPALVRRGWSALLGQGRPIPAKGPPLHGALGSAPARVMRVAASALLASARYRPGFYPGELKLFTPRIRDPALPSPAAIWARHAGALSIIDVAGGHFTMLSAPHVVSAAEALTRCLPAE